MVKTHANIVGLPQTLEEFQRWESSDGFKYEWQDGTLIKFHGMNKTHLKLIRTLNTVFDRTKAKMMGGQLICEQDVKLSAIQLRRPDLAFFSNEQIDKSDDENEPIPAFAIEVISTFDQINAVKAKIKEYFTYGVEVVWLIYPDYEIVEVYTSFKTVKICTDSDVCSASPVLDDFKISVSELLKK